MQKYTDQKLNRKCGHRCSACLCPGPQADWATAPLPQHNDNNIHETHPLCQAHGCGGAHSHLEVTAVTTLFPWRLRHLKASVTRLSSHNW